MGVDRERAKVLDVLGCLRELELVLAEFYAVCRDAWPESDAFWTELLQGELRHATYLTDAVRFVEERPEVFITPRHVDERPVVEQTAYVRERLCQLWAERLGERAALIISRDIEQAIIGAKLYEFVRSEEPRYARLVDEVVSETREHARLVQEQLDR
ncbi:MAG TPA: hypothetical protein VJ787_10615 [Thermoleophilia bacterium]|nr:hypothetical protein [Thermoleophilia bacterium]